MRLRRLFLLLSLALSLTVLAMAAYVVGGAWHQVHRADAGLEAMRQLRALLIAGEMASRERGPSNDVLGDALPGDPAHRARLQAARERTDQAFEGLQQSLDDAEVARPDVRETLLLARRHLGLARRAIDNLASRERNVRTPQESRSAVTRMIGVIEDLVPAANQLINAASASFPAATDALIAARQAAALREYAGQLGSQLTAALSTRLRLTDDEHRNIERLRGRIEQLRQQLTFGAGAAAGRPKAKAATDVLEARYFGSAIDFVEIQFQVGLRDGQYAVGTADFAARYEPEMESIVNLRDILLDEATADAQCGLSQARQLLFWTAVGAGLLVALLGLTGWLLHRRVVQPLASTTALIVTIAEGRLDAPVPAPRYQDEVADMLAAIAVLRDNSIARRQAEEAIRQMAYYDRLTGLPNRRLLEDRMQQVLAAASRHGSQAALLFIDLDKFKQVNDQQGHTAGDWLLEQVANRLRALLRASDTAARVGGDEFIVLLPDASCADDAVRVAEKIRRQMQEPFVMEDGVSLAISTSIGVVMHPDQADNTRDLLHFGDEAMYRAKKRGRNAVELFVSDSQESADSPDAQVMRLIWKPSYVSGCAPIDRAHVELFRLGNQLIELALRKDTDRDQFNEVLDQLLDKARAHFAHEEALLRKLGYPLAEVHGQGHQALLDRAATLRWQSESDLVSLGQLIEFLAGELVAGHIAGEDAKFFALLATMEHP